MPTYDYVCDACGHKLAVFQSITEDALTECPECGEARLRRRIGAGAGIIFKGSGFYETDYKRNRSNGAGAKKNGESSGGASTGTGSGTTPTKKDDSSSGSGKSDKSD